VAADVEAGESRHAIVQQCLRDLIVAADQAGQRRASGGDAGDACSQPAFQRSGSSGSLSFTDRWERSTPSCGDNVRRASVSGTRSCSSASARRASSAVARTMNWTEGMTLRWSALRSEGGGAGPHVLEKFPGDLQRACSREDEVGGARGKVAARTGADGLDDDRS